QDFLAASERHAGEKKKISADNRQCRARAKSCKKRRTACRPVEKHQKAGSRHQHRKKKKQHHDGSKVRHEFRHDSFSCWSGPTLPRNGVRQRTARTFAYSEFLHRRLKIGDCKIRPAFLEKNEFRKSTLPQ